MSDVALDHDDVVQRDDAMEREGVRPEPKLNPETISAAAPAGGRFATP
jgi:hypothetical protein